MPRISVPDFNFSAFYYQEILDALVQFKRQNVPEHTDESPYDALMQFLRMQAVVGHLNNTMIDLVANESTLPTAKLAETVRNMLRLIGYEMRTAAPASVDILLELSKIFTSSFELIPLKAQVATEAQSGVPSRYYESLAALTIQRTDQFGAVFGEESGAFVDLTTEANDGSDWSPWASPVAVDKVYFGHDSVMWNELTLAFDNPASGLQGVWEYYDGSWIKTNPTSVAIYSGGRLEVDLTAYLGITNRQGTIVRVQLNQTTAYEELPSLWDGSRNFVITDGYLGQTSPSLDAADYTVGSDWEPIGAVDQTSNFELPGDVTWELPQSITKNWIKATVNGFEGYFVRFRITQVSTPTPPVFNISLMSEGDHYTMINFVQGKTQVDSPLGSSDGTVNQRFEVSQDNYITNTIKVWVDDELWTEVDNFLASRSTDKHYRVLLGENDSAVIVFGDGVTGKIPPLGLSNIEAEYRWGANENGNVGSETVVVDKTGLSYIARLRNPRPAVGWSVAQGATEDSLEEAKLEGPASLRIKEVAVGPDDAEDLTVGFVDETGMSPISRARAFEGSAGPKTIEIVVVAAGGNQATSDQISALMSYFNGDKYSHPALPKRIVANQEASIVNFTPKTIDIEATVYGSVTSEAIKNSLQAVFQPEAIKEDGITWEWEFGGEIPVSRVLHEIFVTDNSITKVELTIPASDISLNSRELPKIGTVNLTIIEP